jgi:hypothetical protein
MPKYRVNAGMNYPDPKTGEDVRVEAGDVLEHLPAPWLLEQGYVSLVDERTSMTAEEFNATAPGATPAGG